MAINLSKGQTIDLTKAGSPALTSIRMGLQWDAKQPPKATGFLSFLQTNTVVSIDLDASCLLFDGGKLVDTVWFRQLSSKDGSVRHSGDNLTGEGDGDDEVIHVDLAKVASNVTTMLFTVNSFRGQTFNEVEGAACRLVDAGTGQELARYAITGSGSHTGVFMASLKRDGRTWKMQALGEPATGRTATDMAAQAQRYL